MGLTPFADFRKRSKSMPAAFPPHNLIKSFALKTKWQWPDWIYSSYDIYHMIARNQYIAGSRLFVKYPIPDTRYPSKLARVTGMYPSTQPCKIPDGCHPVPTHPSAFPLGCTALLSTLVILTYPQRNWLLCAQCVSRLPHIVRPLATLLMTDRYLSSSPRRLPTLQNILLCCNAQKYLVVQ